MLVTDAVATTLTKLGGAATERVAVGEVLVGAQRHLALGVGAPDPRPLDLDAPPTQRHLPRLVAVTHRCPPQVVLALRTDDLVDLLFHQLGHNAEPNADAQGEQPLLGRVHQLAEHFLHTRRQRELTSHLTHGDLIARYGLHGGPSSCRLTTSHSPRSRRDRTRREDRHLKFYELRDNLARDPSQFCRPWFPPRPTPDVCPPTFRLEVSSRMLADQLDYVVGVDPHRDSHALAVVHVVSGVIVFESTVVASSDGYAHALNLVDQHAPGRRAFAVEGTGSFGAGLTRFLTVRGEQVLEVGRLRRERRSGGKTDALDAVRAARSVLTSERPATPRAGGERQALQALVAAREGAVNARRAGLCQLRDLLITTPEPLRSQLRPLTRARLLQRLAATRPGSGRDPELRGSMLALRSIARRVLQLTAEERELARQIEALTRTLAPQLLEQPGVGPHAAAQLVLSWSHQGRITSEAAFARLAGAAPIPASSGQTIRYRLDRSGDRKLNRALHMILVTRKRSHPATIAYIERRLQEGKTRREATRCLKRYLARSLYRLLEHGAPMAT